MRVGKLTSKILLLKPDYQMENDVGEAVPAWVPFCPYKPEMKDESPALVLTEGENTPRYMTETAREDVFKYLIWASVIPTSGREYEEAQKIRAELTYKIELRYANNIRSDFKVLYKDKILSIESVIDIEGRGRELQLICAEVEGFGEETD